MWVSELEYDGLSDEIIDQILFAGMEERAQNADAILVLGSIDANKSRTPKAFELYKSGYAKKILLSGGMVWESEYGSICEAEMMKLKLLEFGVPENDMLIESQSITTRENIISSLFTMERAFGLYNIRRILLVTAAYHMRRSVLMAQKYMPAWIEALPCPAADGGRERDDWHKTEKGRFDVTAEAGRLIYYINEGSIPDFEIGGSATRKE